MAAVRVSDRSATGGPPGPLGGVGERGGKTATAEVALLRVRSSKGNDPARVGHAHNKGGEQVSKDRRENVRADRGKEMATSTDARTGGHRAGAAGPTRPGRQSPC